MNDLAIQVTGLSKRYRIGRREGYKSLRDSVTSAMSAPFRGLVSAIQRRPSGNGQSVVSDEFIWALRDVSFEIKRGEVVGIIGHNGAGKSTLLKILSRITEPTEGEVMLSGRVGSLLEVGTGFHPELTGRENIYLNSAILGMRRGEIEHKFDEIVAFAEIEKFIDTPVKHYSSGMYVRLAFAVAAHLEPEILLVDEVLAVGDASFQKKCLGKMEEVSGQGRTVVFVSHNMGMIKSLTSRAIWLEKGKISAIGPSAPMVNHYLGSSGFNIHDGLFSGDYINDRRMRHSKYAHQIKLISVRLSDESGRTCAVFQERSQLSADITFSSSISLNSHLEAVIRMRNMEGQLLFTCLPGNLDFQIRPGKSYTATATFNLAPLLPGLYRGEMVLLSGLPQDNVSPAFEFEIVPAPLDESDARTTFFGTAPADGSYATLGLIRVRSVWTRITEV